MVADQLASFNSDFEGRLAELEKSGPTAPPAIPAGEEKADA